MNYHIDNDESYLNDEKFRLLLRKDVFPYEHIEGFENFKETELPPKEKFYSKLSGCGISETDYEHAKKVWQTFNMKNMGDYHDLYLKTDVLLLASVFEGFRNTFIENYGMDTAHFMTLLQFAVQAMLKQMGIELELIIDSEMYHMFEKSIRGGLVQVVQKYANANNKYMGESYDPNKPRSYLTYVDANNLYGWAMMQE